MWDIKKQKWENKTGEKRKVRWKPKWAVKFKF